MDTPWGPPWGTTWFRMRGRVPAEWAGRRVEAVIDLGFVGDWPGNQAEALVHLADGTPLKAVNPLNQYVPIGNPATGGEEIDYLVEAASNPDILAEQLLAAHAAGRRPHGRRQAALHLPARRPRRPRRGGLPPRPGPPGAARTHGPPRRARAAPPRDHARPGPGHGRPRPGRRLRQRRRPSARSSRPSWPSPPTPAPTPSPASATRTSTPPGCGRSARPSARRPAPSPTSPRSPTSTTTSSSPAPRPSSTSGCATTTRRCGRASRSR